TPPPRPWWTRAPWKPARALPATWAITWIDGRRPHRTSKRKKGEPQRAGRGRPRRPPFAFYGAWRFLPKKAPAPATARYTHETNPSRPAGGGDGPWHGRVQRVWRRPPGHRHAPAHPHRRPDPHAGADPHPHAGRQPADRPGG